jgi:hypothetical protein
MKCPICGKEVAPEDPCMPFCSDRCRTIDLGNWASEKYKIEGEPLQPPDEHEDD